MARGGAGEGTSECADQCVDARVRVASMLVVMRWDRSLNLAGTFGIDRVVGPDWFLHRFVLHRRGRRLWRQLWASISATEFVWVAHIWFYIDRS